jgi:UDP-N-acetylmuramyl pentapeptide phosphotransferase/UDP-N-acetylglucosamine-1-phosphate transferase
VSSLLAAIEQPTWDVMVLVFVLAAAASFLLSYPVRLLGLRLKIVDLPGPRSSHTEPVPHLGGIAILAGVMASLLVVTKPSVAFLVAAGFGVLISLISLLDDLVALPSLPRLFVHLAVAAALIWMVDLIPTRFALPYVEIRAPAYVGLVAATLFVVGFVNFFNFMDGINGIAAAQAIWGGLAMGILLLLGGSSNSVLAAIALAGGCLGFLPHNFPKARMFMGDVGATTVGFALAMLALLGSGRTRLPWVAYTLPLGVFIYDATFTLFKRILKKQNFMKPHREHHYQLLVRSGWSHARVTGVQAALMTVCAVTAVAYAKADRLGQVALLVALLCIFVTYSVLVHRCFARHRSSGEATRKGLPGRAGASRP